MPSVYSQVCVDTVRNVTDLTGICARRVADSAGRGLGKRSTCTKGRPSVVRWVCCLLFFLRLAAPSDVATDWVPGLSLAHGHFRLHCLGSLRALDPLSMPWGACSASCPVFFPGLGAAGLRLWAVMFVAHWRLLALVEILSTFPPNPPLSSPLPVGILSPHSP